MQIYEVTKQPLQEGLLGDIGRGIVSAAGGPDLPQSAGDAAKSAAKSAAALTAKGYGPGGKGLPSSSWADKYKTVQKDPAIQQYINSIMQGWSQQVKQTQQQQRKQSMAAAPAPVAQQPTATLAAQPTAPTQPAVSQTKSTVRPTYGKPSEPTVSFAGQRQRPLDPKNPSDAKILAQLKKQGQLHEAPQEYTTPSGIVIPAGAKTDKEPPPQDNPISNTSVASTAADAYKTAFLKWTNSQLQSRDSRYNTITMADVRQHVPDIAGVLDKKLAEVLKARGTPQSAEAIKAYLEVAIAGVQARSQELKNTESQGSLAAASRAQTQAGTVDQSLAKSGVNVGALKNFARTLKSGQARTTGNPELDAMLTKMGVRVS